MVYLILFTYALYGVITDITLDLSQPPLMRKLTKSVTPQASKSL